MVWKRSYDSLRPKDQYSEHDFGYGWASSYQMYVELIQPYQSTAGYQAPPPGYVYQGYIVLPGGARLGFNSVAPTSTTPVVHCTVAPGIPYLVDWYYDSGSAPGTTHFVATSANRTKWTTNEGALSAPSSSAPLFYQPNTIADRNGNTLVLGYTDLGTYAPVFMVPLLTSISDGTTGTILLTINRYTGRDDPHHGSVSSVTDCYGRSVYYNESPWTSGVGVLGVSQIVPTGTSGAVSQYQRYAYGYTYSHGSGSVGDGPPFLHTITVPSPTGSGTQTATINYGDSELVSSIVDANGNTHLYNFNAGNANHTQVTVQNASGSTVYSYTAGYNADMSTTSRTDGAGHATYTVNAFAPNDPFRPSSVSDGNGRTTQMTWDQYGNVLTETPPFNNVRTPVTTTFGWNYANFALGELVSVQHGSKPRTTHSYYEPSGLEASVSRPVPGTVGGTQTVTTTWTYDNLGNILTMTTPGDTAGSTITTTWNYTIDGSYSQAAAIDQPLKITDNLSNAKHFRYDSRGNRLMEMDAIGYETDKTYNIANQLLTTTFPATGQNASARAQANCTYLYPSGPLTSTAEYDEMGTLVRQVFRSYGFEGELTSVTGSTESAFYVYDALYRKTAVKDGNNQSTRFLYGSAGYLYQIVYPGATSTVPGSNDTLTFTQYDNAGHLLQRVDGRNITTNYTYNDPESLLTDIQYPVSTTLNVHYTYDAYSRRSTISDGTGTQSYSYDDNDTLMLHQVTYTDLPMETISYTFYPSGRISQLSTPAGNFSYRYDAVGRMSSQTNPFGETFSWHYYPNDWVQQQTLGNGVTGTYTYNSRGWITGLVNMTSAGTILSQFSNFSYDSVGNRTTQTVSIPSSQSLSGTVNCTYDNRDELTHEGATTAGGYTEDFAYDGNNAGAGNPTTFRGASHTFNADNQDTANAYDGNGNPTSYKGQSVSFDPENRMTGASAGYASDRLTGNFAGSVSCGYTGDGLRAWKTTTRTSVRPISGSEATTITQTTHFLYNGTKPVCELDDSGNVTAVNTFGFEGAVSRHASMGGVFYALDPQGNAIQSLSSTGELLSTCLYDGYGTCVGTVSSSTNIDPWGYGAFWGYYTDRETGLALLTTRYYDPSAGRFLTRDPAGYAGGINLYDYVKNNPVMGYDPQGLQDPIGILPPGIGNPWPDPIIPGVPPFYGYNCGPQDGPAGALPGLPATNADMDACCKDHDDCWAAHGCTFPGGWFCPNPACAQCNKQLCNCVDHVHCAWWDVGCRTIAAFVHHTMGGC